MTVAGNCPCGDATDVVWTGNMPGGPKVSAKRNRDGLYTTFAYDVSTGRLVASCDGDIDASLTSGNPSTCPNTGIWKSYTYDANWPTLVNQIQERSRLSGGNFHTTSFIYATTHPELTARVESGYTLDASGNPTATSLTTQYGYDASSGQLASITEPSGRLTTFQYYPPGSGNNSGMLKQRDVRVSTSPTLLWQSTVYSGYNTFGRATSILLPSGATRTFAYNPASGRLTSTTLGADTTGFDYYASGRLKQVTEPSGRNVVFNYDDHGRLSQRTEYDSSTTSGPGYNMTYLWYDNAGRNALGSVYQVDSGGGFHLVQYWAAAYDSRGSQTTISEGGAITEQRLYDEYGMGFLQEVDRPDGDKETFAPDHFGRPTTWTRTIAGSSASQFTANYVSLATGTANETSPPTQVTDPQGRLWNYTYDDFGNLVKSVSPGMGTSRWVYANGLVSDVYHPNGSRSNYAYDVAGRLRTEDHNYGSTTARGQDFTYVYDDDGTSVSCPFTTVSGFYAYAPCLYRKGRLAQVIVEASPTSTWSTFRDYTAEGYVRSDRYIDGSSQVDYQYASGGRLLRTRVPWGGYRMRNDYDATPGDPEMPTMVSGIVMENNAGSAVFTWARNMTHDGLGRLASAYLADNSSSTTPSIRIARRTDGRMSSMQIYSGAGIGGPSGNIADYNYAYHSDLMLKSITNSAGAGRFFYYDGANRLTCDATTGTACPANGSPALVAAYGYDTADNRTSSASSASATSTTYTYPNPGATVAPELTSVLLPGGRTVAYSYYADGTRYIDNETTSGVPTNTRNLYYDGVGRLNSLRISDAVAGAAAGTIQTHVINVWYDPWSRPVLVNNLNTTTNVNESYRYYWGFDNRLLAIKRTPNTAVGGNFDVDEYVEIGPVVGVQRLHYVNSALSTTSRWYTARSHNGQPIASWSATSPYAETWRATATSAFGEVLAQTGDPTKRGPWGFLGHIQVPDSSVEVWNGSALTQLRPSLYLTNWRAYDPMLGAWTAPEPARWEGWLPEAPAYAYANQSPLAYGDIDGRASIYILYPGYPITTPWGRFRLAHGAVVSVDDATGSTRYYEYGRYPGGLNSPACGSVRRRPVPNLAMEDGMPTTESMEALLRFVSREYGHDSPVYADYYAGVAARDVNSYAEEVRTVPGCEYGLTYNCLVFATVAAQGGPTMDPIPFPDQMYILYDVP